MDVLVTRKYEEDSIKNEGATVVTTLYSKFSDAQGQSLVRSGRISNSSEMLWMFKYEEDPIKNEGARFSQHFPHYNPM